MSTTTRISTAERLGRSFGRGWRAYARGERRASNWLVSKGVPMAGATVLLWTVKLVVLGLLFYAVFWMALLLVFVMVVAWMARNADLNDELPEPEWRNGPAGFGLYTYDGFRIDPHVQDD
ncbi:TPA: DUF3742 family protein [Pseudomonas aeruginosa]|jgi:Flp pilus assembly protein TadB|uniref:DUF3742 domain-containing protein n=5 Tax=Pseudomonadota TaxID=1224 RepID=A9C314_DELAS|nr:MULTISPECIES: DUF3742 family protein [Pseudomonadota]AID83312.1 signal peptide protein [Pseudomonas aeruginosa VRFPA04]HBM64304.1 DUF3742 domain-containing protein [Pseudomonas sp.]ABX36818.1 conserved hypothetical protein [Delftia acidovorans SPH-1]AOX35149.1 hypothetical protein PA8281_05961 [Pseudomonas aeruginosa]AOX41863.1 hypothetical protein PA11803_05476 [Pseudomonas aeruginosa]